MNGAASRVRALVDLAARCATPGDPLHAELRSSLIAGSGLSAAGVDLAIGRHLETSISAVELASLLTHVGETAQCHVVLSAHVCTAALRAMVLAVATSPRVFVKASRRDPFLAELLVREGRATGLSIEATTNVDARAGDEVHVYGGSEAIEAIRAELPRGVRFRAHGPGFGVALVGGDAHDEAAELLVDDVVPFDQRGCLSPRIALVEEDACGFAYALDRALTRREAVVSRGPLSNEEATEAAIFAELGRALGEVHAGPAHVVVHDPEPESALLPPAGRSLLVLSAARAHVLAPLAGGITNVGVFGRVSPSSTLSGRGAKFTALGKMQRPALDGPVDARTQVTFT